MPETLLAPPAEFGFSPNPFPQIAFGQPSVTGIGQLHDPEDFRRSGTDFAAAGQEAGNLARRIFESLGGLLKRFPLPREERTRTGTATSPRLPREPVGTTIFGTPEEEIITIPRAEKTPEIDLPRLPIITVPRKEKTREKRRMELPGFFGTGPGFDPADIFDIAGRIFGDVNEPFGGFGGGPIRLDTGGNGNGGTTQVANGSCPPARARMPSSIMADDPCSPNNPTIYIKAGKASSLISPQLISSQSRKLSRANKSIPKKVVRRKKK